MIGAARGLQAEAEAQERPGVGEAVAGHRVAGVGAERHGDDVLPRTVAAETRFSPAWPVVPVLTP